MSVLCLHCMCHSADGEPYCSACGAPLLAPTTLLAAREKKREMAQVELGFDESVLSECAEGATKELFRTQVETQRELFELAEQSVREIAVSRVYVPWQVPKVGDAEVNSVGSGWGIEPFDFAVDVLRPCVVGSNTLRFFLSVNRGALENVTLKVQPHLGNCVLMEQQLYDLGQGEECERMFTVKDLPEGSTGCDIVLRFEREGVCHQYVGQVEVNVNRHEDLLDVVRQNINIHYNPQTTIGNVGQASDVKVLHKSDGGLGKALEGIRNIENPMGVIDRMSRAGDRTYRRIPLKSMFGSGLGNPPSEARTREVEVRLGYDRVQFFVDDIICIGHSVDNVRYSDIVIDAPVSARMQSPTPYDRISRIHCMIRHYGQDVEICDGRVGEDGRIIPSSNGTVLNLERLPPCKTNQLRDGELRLGTAADAVRLNVRVVHPATCAHCKIAEDERVSCAGGGRPCVVVSRPDDLNLKYVALWSCFDLGNVNQNYKGIEIFHYNGAFGWRRGRKTGWLTSGVNFASSQIEPISVLRVWDR